jgi:hypothetical protein
MAVEDYAEPEVAVAVAVTAALASSKARRVMRQGAVYGLAGIFKAGDALGVFARGVSRGVQQAGASAEGAANEIVLPGDGEPPSAPARTRSSRAKSSGGEEANT